MKLLIKLSIIMMFGCVNSQSDIYSCIEQHVDSIKKFTIDSMKAQSVVEFQEVDLHEGVTLKKLIYKGDTLFCFDSVSYYNWAQELENSPIKIWKTDSTLVEFHYYPPAGIGLKVERNDRLIYFINDEF